MSELTPMRTSHSFRRRGFSLPEILVSLVILGIIGLAFVRLVVAQSRFAEGQMSLRNARTVSRNALNILLTDIRMVQDSGGLIYAARDSVTMRVPVAFGLLCANASGVVTMQILPVDSAMTALGQYAGWAYRDSVTGAYNYRDANSPTSFNSLTTGVATVCTNSAVVAGVAGPGIQPISFTTPNGTRSSRVISVTDGPSGSPNVGWPVFIYQQITYKFDSSTAYPHRVGLFRKVKTANPNVPIVDEIVAPFDTSAKFRFYSLNADVATTAPPANLNSVRGLELVLSGSSPRAEQGMTSAQQALVTGVFFKNGRNP
jgi:prepilin-type N-terminal cleavage/methylation domain-containing protein